MMKGVEDARRHIDQLNIKMVERDSYLENAILDCARRLAQAANDLQTD